jgi:hypothetical protein
MARSQAHELKLNAGTTYVIDLHSAVFDTYLKVLDSKGKLLVKDARLRPRDRPAGLIFSPPEDGTFRIVTTSLLFRHIYAYTLTIRAIDSKTK